MAQKKSTQLFVAASALTVLVIAGVFIMRGQSVVEKYDVRPEKQRQQAAVLSSTQVSQDARMLSGILAEVDVLERAMNEMNRTFKISKNKNAGIYTVDQELKIAQTYARYLQLRKGLFHVLFRHQGFSALPNAAEQDQAFLLAYIAGLSLYRNAAVFVTTFKEDPEARKKLNEKNIELGIAPGVFDEIYANITNDKNVTMMIEAMADYHDRRTRLESNPLLRTPGLEKVLPRLDRYEAELEAAYVRLSEGKADITWNTLKAGIGLPAYRAQTLVSTLVGFVRSPLHSEPLDAKEVRRSILPRLKPGDILITRRDGYLSNTFLPGNWGHAALFLGSVGDVAKTAPLSGPRIADLLKKYDGKDIDGFPLAAIEAIGEGVRFSSIEFALHANRVAVLRPKLSPEKLAAALSRAMSYEGAPYDFSFDLSSQDKIICTELVYRAYEPDIDMPLTEMMGRQTLNPDELLRALLGKNSDAAPATLVLYGTAVDGKLAESTREKLSATVALN